MRAQNKEVLLNDSLLLQERDLVPSKEVIPWRELVERVNRFSYVAMDREFDTREEVQRAVAGIDSFIRAHCPEGNGRREVLEGMMWAHVTARFEDTLEREARVFLIEANIRAQHGLYELRRLSFKERQVVLKALQAREGGECRMMYVIGALAVARVAIAIEELGHKFQLATTAEDAIGGIDGWLIRKGFPRIPLGIKSGLKKERARQCVISHTLSNKIKYGIRFRQRDWLEMEGLAPRMLLVTAPNVEQNGDLRSILVLESGGVLVAPLRRALARWHRSVHSLRGNASRPRVPRKRYH